MCPVLSFAAAACCTSTATADCCKGSSEGSISSAACRISSWRPLIEVRGGVAFVSDLGKSKTFPANNPEIDEQYAYHPKHPTEVRALGGIFAGAEFCAMSSMRVQCGLNYNQPALFSVNGTFTQGVDVQSQDSYTYRYKIQIRQLLVEGKLLYSGFKRLYPYLSLGLGASFNRAFNYSTNVPSSLTFTRMYQNHTSYPFTYSAGVGIDCALVRHVRIGLGYCFTDFGKVRLGSASIDNSAVSGTLSQSHFYSNVVFGEFIIVF